MPAFLDRLARLYPDDRTETERLRAVLGVQHFVHLFRADRVAQAVSLVLAMQTGLWHRNADGSERERNAPPQQPRYDQDQVAAQLRVLEAEVTGWQTWFESTGVKPLTLTYEELDVDPTDGLERVLQHLGIVTSEHAPLGTAKMASQLNKEWSARFRAEAAIAT